ncbi:MAG: hypothetical protein K1X63_07070 [Chitinophagales bacterium]|nr:hypothetical protein [Bacteroidota bacterium]MBX7140828.1 hypothetical protein [Chitinophagales bacterium]
MEDKKAGRFGFDRLASENRFFRFLRQISMPLCRISFFVVFFWFGALKILELSPAEGVVHTLYEHTVPWIPWKIFIFGFGAYECIIGIIFLFPGMEKWALYMLIPHMITTFGPLVIMPKLVWKGFMIPNLIGQYIIKNLVIIALAIFIAASVWEGKNNVNAQKEEEEKRKAMKRA